MKKKIIASVVGYIAFFICLHLGTSFVVYGTPFNALEGEISRFFVTWLSVTGSILGYFFTDENDFK